MNIALSILSAAASAEAAGTAEAYSGPWENVYNAVHSTAEAVTEEAQGVVDRIQGLGDAHAQLADPDYWAVGIITLTGILVVFFILAILIFLFWALGKTFQTIDKNRAAKAEAAKKAAAPAPAAVPATVEEIVEEDDNDDEIMAVISAAIAAYAEEEGTSYTIRDVKKRDKRARSAWSLAGIGENTRPF
ncbi:MAG: OadG family protein [Oscillospiraceae bacterium]